MHRGKLPTALSLTQQHLQTTIYFSEVYILVYNHSTSPPIYLIAAHWLEVNLGGKLPRFTKQTQIVFDQAC